MIVGTYNTNDEFVSNITDVYYIEVLKDGRLLIHSKRVCECCNQDVKTVTQIPKHYRVDIFTEALPKSDTV